MVKKLIGKTLIALIPLALLAVFFFVFEPSDYWGIKGKSNYNERAISGLREVLLKDVDRIIVGDSRTANLNEGAIEEASGKDYCDLAFGGATLDDSLRMVNYALDHDDIKEIVIGLSFYNMNDNHSSNRVDPVIPIAEDPAKYIKNAQYWTVALKNFNAAVLNPIADLTGADILRVDIEDPSQLKQVYQLSEEYIHGWRRDLWDYGVIINEQMDSLGYSFSGNVEKLRELAAVCEERDIELVFILFPSNRVIWENVIYTRGMDVELEAYKEELKKLGTVYDMEFYSELARTDDLFQDGFHMTLDGKMMVIDAVFGNGEYDWCIVTEKQ